MPLIIPKDLISESVLKEEKIFTMDQERADSQDIRPLKIAIVNLMPKKEETELQLIRVLSNTALQINIDLVRMRSHNPKNTSHKHLEKFYKTFDEIKNTKYDAMIFTGAESTPLIRSGPIVKTFIFLSPSSFRLMSSMAVMV